MQELFLQCPDPAAFILYACRYARPSVSIQPFERGLRIRGMSPENAARALAYGVFPSAEKQALARIIQKNHRSRKANSRQKLIDAACLAKELYIPRLPWQGRECGAYLEKEFRRILETTGRLDMTGFRRFRMRGYADYLRELLAEGEKLLQRQEEEDRYYDILSRSLTEGKGRVTLFFDEPELCHIWQIDDNGLRQLEGGRIHGAEWLLVANLISLDPACIELKDREKARPELLDMLDKVFGSKILKNS